MYYFDHASTSMPKPQPVIDAVVHAMQHTGSSGRGAHDVSLEASRTLLGARNAMARLFGVGDPGRVAFAANATEALNTAVKGLLHPGDHVITTQWEHNSVLRPLYELGSVGVEMSVVPADSKGRLEGVPDWVGSGAEDAVDWGRFVRPNTKAVVCNHASNVTGNVLDLEAVGRFCRERNLLFVVDVAQTAGMFPIDVEALGIDVLCFTGHKSLLGPQGTGGLYVRKGLQVRPLRTGGSGIMTFSRLHPQMMPEALEAGTQNVHGLAGLRAGVEYLFELGMASLRQREQELAGWFFEQVRDLDGVTVYGDFSVPEQRAPIVSLNVGEEHSGVVADVLGERYAIFTRAGGHCAPLMHVALGTRERGAVRFSFSHWNTHEDVEAAVRAVDELARGGVL